MNRARQAEITQEILEVVAGADALDCAEHRSCVSDRRRRDAPNLRSRTSALDSTGRGRLRYALLRACGDPRTQTSANVRLRRRRPRADGRGRVAAAELGESIDGQARGYWEQVWRRFRRDKVAIVERRLHHLPAPRRVRRRADRARSSSATGPNDHVPERASTRRRCCPVGPWTHVSTPDSGRRDDDLLRPRRRRHARPRRVPAPALRRAGLARGRDRRDVRCRW